MTDTTDSKQIHCGDLLSEETKDILVDVHLPSIPASSCSPFKFGTLHASYFDVKTRCMLTRHVDLTIQRSDTYVQVHTIHDDCVHVQEGFRDRGQGGGGERTATWPREGEIGVKRWGVLLV